MTVAGAALERWRLVLREGTWGDRVAWAAPLLPVWLSMLVLGVALLPEVTVPAPSLNDNAAHYSLILNASRAIEAGLNPVDHWAPDLEAGYPQFAYYQHLPHLFVVAVERLLLRQVELLTLFNLTRYALLVGFPITVYWSLRQLGFSRPAAGAAAALAPLLSAGHRFGLEYDSFVWRGFGMYTQFWAMHLIFLSLALVHRTLQDGKGYFLSVLALSALVLSHVIYAFVAAITLGFVLLAGTTRANTRQRVLRLALVGAPAVVVTAYFWVPLIVNGVYHASSPYMEDWKYNSFGAGTIMGWLVRGDLLDHGRPPVLTGFAAIGVLVALWTRTRLAFLALAVFGFWLVAYFGRPTLGPVADLLSLDGKLWMHRFIGPMQMGAVLLIAVAAGGVLALLRRLQPPGGLGGSGGSGARAILRRVPWPATVFGALLLAVTLTALVERWSYLERNDRWLHETEQAVAADTELAEIVATLESLPRGRVFAGIRSGFSEQMRVGSLRVSDILTFNQIETAAPPYQSLSLNSDLIWHFDYTERAHYEVLNARYVILPASLAAPDFLTPLVEGERYQLLEAPSGGYFALVETPVGFEGSVDDYHIASRAWFRSRAPGDGLYPAFAIPGAPRLEGLEYEPMARSQSVLRRFRPEHEREALGAVTTERAGRFDYEATVRVDVPSALVLKATFHPDWRVYVDGKRVPPFMVAPSFPAIHLEPGEYSVRFAYAASAWRTPLLAMGLLTLGTVALAEWRWPWLRQYLRRSRR